MSSITSSMMDRIDSPHHLPHRPFLLKSKHPYIPLDDLFNESIDHFSEPYAHVHDSQTIAELLSPHLIHHLIMELERKCSDLFEEDDDEIASLTIYELRGRFKQIFRMP